MIRLIQKVRVRKASKGLYNLLEVFHLWPLGKREGIALNKAKKEVQVWGG